MMMLLLAVVLLPLIGSALLMVRADRVTPQSAAWIGCGAVGGAALAVITLGVMMFQGGGPVVIELGNWFSVNGFEASAALRLDRLSLVLAFVITFVGFLIHLYSVEYMAGDEGFARYFAWLNLFVFAMLLLVLADDLLLLFAGWEGVGLCSYLLIGFWYRDPQNGYAARKAFVMTRLGDTLLLIGLLYLALRFNTLRMDEVVTQARSVWLPGAGVATAVALLLLGGALGKSAQVPLQTWLPDAMAGPTPVSALIHAATMVTAGVYLIARLHGLFQLSPVAMGVIAAIGALTLLLGATSALAQSDIKRILAYSTISQIGYMFLALGLGAWSAAIFHLFTHAFFKALLFLAAGALILAADHEQEIDRMGADLRRRLPLVFWSFVAGGASLAALPLITAGFFSKEAILAAAWQAPLWWLAGWLGAVATAAYVIRTIAHVFFTPRVMTVHHTPRATINAPLVVLAVGAIGAGFVDWPEELLPVHLFTAWLAPVTGAHPPAAPWIAAALGAAAPFIGLLLWWSARRVRAGAVIERVRDLLRAGWRFDALYARVGERPWNEAARASAGETLDGMYDGIVRLHQWAWRRLSAGQNGLVRRYAAALVVGAIILVGIAYRAPAPRADEALRNGEGRAPQGGERGVIIVPRAHRTPPAPGRERKVEQ